MLLEFATFVSYFVLLLGIAILSYQKQKSEADFIIGNRSLNFWLTALSAHASDMSSWLFLGYPALIFVTGVTGSWAAIGLIVCMFLSSYFENRFGDTSGKIRIVSAIMSIFFYTFYISSGLVGMGILVESLFG